tara:strand:+ start:410 stop:733 length:324 start_codon:yes stop_codon:yes gene_type:complete
MCAPAIIAPVATLVGGLLISSMFKGRGQQKMEMAKAAPIQKPQVTEEDATVEELKADDKPAPIAKTPKRAQMGINPDMTPSDLKTPGVSGGTPVPGGRTSPTGVVSP